MNVKIRKFKKDDIMEMTAIWNDVVEEGTAFPQVNKLALDEAEKFFESQSFTAVAESDGEVVGIYILHPNNVGRCGHIANASYAVKLTARGMKIGEMLVSHSLKKGKELGYGILQFNAVVSTNTSAIHLYDKLGFVRLGMIPKGFLSKNNRYEDIILFYHIL